MYLHTLKCGMCKSVYVKHTLNTVPVKNEVLRRDKEERNTLYAIKRRKDNWIGHILRRNRLAQHVIEGNIERRDVEEDVSSYCITSSSSSSSSPDITTAQWGPWPPSWTSPSRLCFLTSLSSF